MVALSDANLAVSLSLVGNEGMYAPSDTLYIITEIRNSQASGRIDVIVTYQLFDEDRSVLSESSTVAIETLSSFSKTLKLPDSLQSGSYVLRTTVSSLDGSTQSQASLLVPVIKISENGQMVVEYIMGASLVVAVIALFYEHHRISKIKLCSEDLNRYIERKQ